MRTHTIKVSGVSEELLHLLDEKVQSQHATGRAEYVRELIRRDVLGPSAPPKRTLREILAPVHAEARERGYTEEDIDQFVEEAFTAHRREQQGQRTDIAEPAP